MVSPPLQLFADPVAHVESAVDPPVDALDVISPELVLVDPELGRLARALLPDHDAAPAPETDQPATPVELPTSITTRRADRVRVDRSPAEPPPPLALVEPLQERRDGESRHSLAGVAVLQPRAEPVSPRRLARWVVPCTVYVLAVVTAVLIGRVLDSEREVTLVQDAPSARNSNDRPARRTVFPQKPAAKAAPKAPARPRTSRARATAKEKSAPSAAPASPPAKTPQRRATTAPRDATQGARSGVGEARTPPSNVLGVVVTAGHGTVTLSWARPGDSAHVVVLRERRVRSGEKASYGDARVVYRGTGTSHRDRGVENGVEYRYVIVNYDRTGNASSGVPTVVVPR